MTDLSLVFLRLVLLDNCLNIGCDFLLDIFSELQPLRIKQQRSFSRLTLEQRYSATREDEIHYSRSRDTSFSTDHRLNRP